MCHRALSCLQQTCDNILELPNYHESMAKLWRHEHPTPRTALPPEAANKLNIQCTKLLDTKLTQVTTATDPTAANPLQAAGELHES